VTSVGVAQAKQRVRERVWALLERERAAPPGVRGHIPAFLGAAAASDRLAALDVSGRGEDSGDSGAGSPCKASDVRGFPAAEQIASRAASLGWL
jgi:hypothetical protein